MATATTIINHEDTRPQEKILNNFGWEQHRKIFNPNSGNDVALWSVNLQPWR
jgi:hypothetical protein